MHILAVLSWIRVGGGTTLERRKRKEKREKWRKRESSLGLLFRRVVPICSDLVWVDDAHNIESYPIAHVHKQTVGSLPLMFTIWKKPLVINVLYLGIGSLSVWNPFYASSSIANILLRYRLHGLDKPCPSCVILMSSTSEYLEPEVRSQHITSLAVAA